MKRKKWERFSIEKGEFKPETKRHENNENVDNIGAKISVSGVAQWKRAGLITQRSVDRNHSPLYFFF